MKSKEEIEKAKENFNFFNEGDYVTKEMVNSKEIMFEYMKQLETDKQKLIEKLEDRIKSVKKCYQDLIEPYYDKTIDIINTSFMTKKEKAEFINKRNCLLVQKHCYEEILKILKGENLCYYKTE